MPLEKKIHPMPEDYDHDRVTWLDKIKQKGLGFINKKDNPEKKIALTECPACSKENYVMYVMKGKCCFCAFDANHKEKI